MLTGSFSSKYLLILLRCYTAALNRIQKVFDSFKVSVILLTINVKNTSLTQLAAEIPLKLLTRSHLIPTGNFQRRMRCYPQAKVLWSLNYAIHKVKLRCKIFGSHRNVGKACMESGRSKQPAGIQVSRTEAEPASHLHKGIVCIRAAGKIAHCQSFQCQASGEFVAANDNDIEWFSFMVFVKKNIIALTIDTIYADFLVSDQAFSFRPDAVPANIITPRHIFAELRPHFAGCRNIVFFPNRLKLTFNDGITIANMVLNLFFKIFQNLLFNLILLANEADNMD